VNNVITPFEAHFSEAMLEDVKRRLERTRYPDAETVEDWQQGLPLSYQQELVRHWQQDYDWQRVPSRLNRFDNFTTEIDGINIHFLHIRSPHSAATPLLMTHGWPGSVLEFLEVITPLSDPTQSGGTPNDAFHLVIPSLPGFGFSEAPTMPGVGVEKIAAMWDQLMLRAGYPNYLAQGGDWGSLVTHALLVGDTRCKAGHINLPLVLPDEQTVSSTEPAEQATLAAAMHYQEHESGYSRQQSTRPQTLAYGLADSPSGQMAWIIEKFAQWTDCERQGIRHPENALTRDVMLDVVSHYWMTNSAASSARLYWESFNHPNYDPIERPIGISLFPRELFLCSERLARTRYRGLVYFNNSHARGGHFAALEQPEAFVADLRQWRAKLDLKESTE
jgi:pimeloyl-ACP methyl ester carboxylesterase